MLVGDKGLVLPGQFDSITKAECRKQSTVDNLDVEVVTVELYDLLQSGYVVRRNFMEKIKVKDLMVPVGQYACVSQDDTLYEAVVELEQAKTKYMSKSYPHRAVLVCDKDGRVIGKLAYLDVLRALEPRYSELTDLKKVSGFGLSAEFMKSMMDRYELWKAPLDDLCHKAAQVTLGAIVSAPLEGEVIDQDSSLDKAIHQMILGHYQSLLVISEERIVGILRLTDVFTEVSNRIKACKI